jgi:hypothetical protein
MLVDAHSTRQAARPALVISPVSTDRSCSASAYAGDASAAFLYDAAVDDLEITQGRQARDSRSTRSHTGRTCGARPRDSRFLPPKLGARPSHTVPRDEDHAIAGVRQARPQREKKSAATSANTAQQRPRRAETREPYRRAAQPEALHGVKIWHARAEMHAEPTTRSGSSASPLVISPADLLPARGRQSGNRTPPRPH